MNRNQVLEVQHALGVDTDGIYGPATHSALMRRLKGREGALKTADKRTRLCREARKWVGISEAKDPDAVAAFGGGDTETPWCAHFVNSMLEIIDEVGTYSGAARSFMEWGEEVKLEDIRVGDIVVWPNHVAIFVEEDEGLYYCVSGNMSNAVKEHPATKGWGTPIEEAAIRRIPS